MNLPSRSVLAVFPAGAVFCVVLAVILTPNAPASPPILKSTSPQPFRQPPTTAIQHTPLPQMLKVLASSKQGDREMMLKIIRGAQSGDAPLLHQLLHRQTNIAAIDYKNILRGIGALVPNRAGRFSSDAPQRQIDWLDGLLRIKPESINAPLRPALSESLLNVALIRSLAATKHYDASLSLLRFAYRHNGAFKDECGQQIRRIGAYAIPGLIRATNLNDPQAFKIVRYAQYQLDRMNYARPDTALKQTDLALQAEILHAYGEVRHLGAPTAIIRYTNAPSKKVQSSARWAMLRYLSGRPPKAVKRKLTLIGGQQTEEARSLYFTYLELAKHAVISRLAQELSGQKTGATFDELNKTLPRESEPRDLAERLFALFDQKDAKKHSIEFEKTMTLAKHESLSKGIFRLDKLLAANPLHPRRQAMAPLYFKYGQQLMAKSSLTKATTMLSKSIYLDPQASFVQEARALRFVAQALTDQSSVLESEWKIRSALDLIPTLASAQSAMNNIAQRNRHRLYIAGSVGSGSVLLLLLGLAFARKKLLRK